MELTSENVETVLRDCLFEKDPSDLTKAIIAEGIVNKFGFDPERVQRHEEDILSMLRQLPKEFLKSGGGGMSFLNACNRTDGVQWTGLHRRMDELFCLGMAIKKVQYCLPRNMWSVFPGGMPYLTVDA